MAWSRMRYRNGKIWAEVDDQGRMLVSDGLIRGKYKEDDDRTYSFRADAVRLLDGRTPTKVDSDGALDALAGAPSPASPSGAASSITAGIIAQAAKPSSGASGAASNGAAAKPAKGKRGGAPGEAQVSALNNESPVAALGLATQDYIAVYTDGATSGNPGPSGLGVILRWGPYHREIYQYLGSATNNIAELTAIKVGLEAVKNRSIPVKIFTDSQYSIGVLSGQYKVNTNHELIQEIKDLMKNFPKLKLEKVRGHSGDPLNERADELARLAITEARSSG